MSAPHTHCREWLARLAFEAAGDPAIAGLLSELRARIDSGEFQSRATFPARMAARAAMLADDAAIMGAKERRAVRVLMKDGNTHSGALEGHGHATLRLWSVEEGYIEIPLCLITDASAAELAPLDPLVLLHKLRASTENLAEITTTRSEQAVKALEEAAAALDHLRELVEEERAAGEALSAENSALVRQLREKGHQG